MTGLFGFVCEGRETSAALHALGAMQRLSSYRYGVSDEPFCDGYLGAGRTCPRPAHVEDQPVSAEDVHVWVDGEIYGGPGAVSPAAGGALAPPAAGLLDLYLRTPGDWSFLRDIDGIYAAVIYDAGRRQVHFVGDRCGLATFYWTLIDNRPAWASTLAALLAAPDFKVVVDRVAVEQFLGAGHPLGERSMLEGASLLAPGTVVTWDGHSGRISTQRYWWWDRIAQCSGGIDPREAAEELGRLLRHSVAVRCPPGERVGVSLSGGLDSRALLAAMPDRDAPVHTVTFGQPGCLDVQIARRVAGVRGAAHDAFDITSDNWIEPRSAGVWITDGGFNLINLHGVEAEDLFAEVFDVNLNGYGGDFVLGGMYLTGVEPLGRFDVAHAAKWMSCSRGLLGDTSAYEPLAHSDFYYLENRSRRLNNPGTRHHQTIQIDRKPFMANQILEFVYSLPDSLRVRGRLYHRMLSATFPDYFRRISWQSTGIPLGWPRGAGRVSRYKRRLEVRLTGRATAVGIHGRHPVGYTDYPAWLRVDPGRRFFDDLLRDPEALYPEYADRDHALGLWEGVLAGEDKCKEVGRYVTVEIWLQQVFNGRSRPETVSSSRLLEEE